MPGARKTVVIGDMVAKFPPLPRWLTKQVMEAHSAGSPWPEDLRLVPDSSPTPHPSRSKGPDGSFLRLPA